MNQNKDLKGDALKTAAEKQDWDGSVKALVATTSVLQMMNEHLEWTQKLGEAFLAQQQDVMDAVQRLRTKAYDRKKLVTTNEQKVTVTQDQNRQIIYIEPSAPGSIYVPYYEPQVVFGDWPYFDYPAYPYYWGYPATSESALSLPGWHSARRTHWGDGRPVVTGAAVGGGTAAGSTGAAEPSTSIAAPASNIGNTMLGIGRVRATTIRTCNRGLATPINGQVETGKD